MATKYHIVLFAVVVFLFGVIMMGIDNVSQPEMNTKVMTRKLLCKNGCNGCSVITDTEADNAAEGENQEDTTNQEDPINTEESPIEPSTVSPLHVVNRQQVNPHNVIHVPRPNPDAANVPLLTDFFVMVGTKDDADQIDPNSVSITLHPDGGHAFAILEMHQRFPIEYTGKLFFTNDGRYGPALAIYVDSAAPLLPETRYRIKVTATSALGATIPNDAQSWFFKTESAPSTPALTFALDLSKDPDVKWQGEFFNAIAKSSFCTSARSRLPHYDLIAEAQATYPHAWNLQRDAYLSGYEHQLNPFKNLPNIVREQETRRIVAITRENNEAVLHVEDFVGHAQYGVAANRPLNEDFQPGDEVMIADGVNSVRSIVIAAHDNAHRVRVTDFETPAAGWQFEYSRPLPESENPDVPGLFPPGGTYLRKFNPVGTPCYYWGRVNHEWDIVQGKYGRRVVPRFADAIGCLAVDGQAGTTAKDLVQHHEAIGVITRYLIERYGDETLQWPWVVLNEPDLMAVYWRNRDWNELQRFYDYTVDAILGAFEACGYDSHKVNVGGLELGAIWGAQHLRLDDFLVHCSPNKENDNALTLNAAYADPRLDGKRSDRIERLCSANDGRGSPLDFLSIHTYNNAKTASEKLIRAKERALEIDADYYEALAIVSHETVPTWRPVLDPGAGGMYLDNGYFTSWMADYQARLLQQGMKDARYAYGGDLMLMHWPGIVKNFDILNDTVREIQLADRSEVIPSQAFHFVNLLSTMRNEYWVFPQKQIGAHSVSGFAALTEEDLRVVFYAHHHEDTASRSETDFEIVLNIKKLTGDFITLQEYRFDDDHNSCYRLARRYRAAHDDEKAYRYSELEFQEIREQAELKVCNNTQYPVDDSGCVQISVTVNANGTTFLIVNTSKDS